MITTIERPTLKALPDAEATGTYSISEEALGHITTILQGLYAEPFTAVLREYLHNAIDSHTEAGQTLPVELSLPSREDPTLIVRDYGTGLSRTDAERLLFGFGESGSLKRGSNQFIGAFGLGSKSGFAVAREFTYTIWDGLIRRKWRCYLDSDNRGHFDRLEGVPDDTPRGVEVRIPFNTGFTRQIQTAIDTVLPYQDNVKVVRTGHYKIPQPFTPLATLPFTWNTQLAGKVHLTAADSSLRVLMGGNCFETDVSSPAHPILRFLIAELPLGTLPLTPSRESLQSTPRAEIIQRALRDELCQPEIQTALLDQVKANPKGPLYILAELQRTFGIDFGNPWIGPGQLRIPRGLWTRVIRFQFRRWSSYCLNSRAGFTTTAATEIDYTTRDTGFRYFVTQVPTSTTISAMREVGYKLAALISRDYGMFTSASINVIASDADIPWMQDGSVYAIQAKDLPEDWQNHIAFRRPSRRTRTEPRTKLLRYEPSTAQAMSAWWASVPQSLTPPVGIYVRLRNYRPIDFHDHPRGLQDIVKNLRITLYGAAKSPGKDWVELWDYLAQEFRNVDAGAVLGGTLLTSYYNISIYRAMELWPTKLPTVEARRLYAYLFPATAHIREWITICGTLLVNKAPINYPEVLRRLSPQGQTALVKWVRSFNPQTDKYAKGPLGLLVARFIKKHPVMAHALNLQRSNNVFVENKDALWRPVKV